MHVCAAPTFDAWVSQCRDLVRSGASPDEIFWHDMSANLPTDLFASESVSKLPTNAPPITFTVPRGFRDLAHAVFHHRSPDRLYLLYCALWRIVNGERLLLEKLTDPVVHPLYIMKKQVTRDAHKMKAFVRFRRVVKGETDWYVAWHRPDHPIIRYTASFFKERFTNMNWSVLTPDESVHWNQIALTFSPGVAKDPVHVDLIEELWRTYYASVFNPARLKIKAMKTEMPVRYWKTLPEATIIPDLIAASEGRTAAMLEVNQQNASQYIPPNPTINILRETVNSCRGCPLFHGTTQAVCSEGPADSPLVLIGEQPGNEEDINGQPFTGPAGQILNRALHDAGIDRDLLYITEAVKHFKHEMRNGRRYHRSPSATDVAACRPWLLAEMEIVKPKVLVCLGVSAAHSVIGKKVSLSSTRDQIISTPICETTIVTTHPAAVLRHPDSTHREAAYLTLVTDLKRASAIAFNVPT